MLINFNSLLIRNTDINLKKMFLFLFLFIQHNNNNNNTTTHISHLELLVFVFVYKHFIPNTCFVQSSSLLFCADDVIFTICLSV